MIPRLSLLGLLRTGAVLLAALAVATVLPRFGVPARFRPDLVVLLVAASAVVRGPAQGALLGLAAGWVVDLVPPGGSPLGLTALLYAAAGATAGLFHRGAHREPARRVARSRGRHRRRRARWGLRGHPRRRHGRPRRRGDADAGDPGRRAARPTGAARSGPRPDPATTGVRSHTRRRRPTSVPRLVVVAALVVSVFALLLGRLGQVQVVQRTAYAGPAAASLETRTTVQPAVRGRILDAQGEPLTDNTSERRGDGRAQGPRRGDGRGPRARRPHRRGLWTGRPSRSGSGPSSAGHPARRHLRPASTAPLPTDPARRERRPRAGPEPAGAAGELPGCGRRGRAGPHLPRAARRQRRPPAGLRRPGQRRRRDRQRRCASPRTRPSGGTGWRRSTTGSCAARTAPRRSRSTRAASSSTGWRRRPRLPAATSSRTSRRRSRPPPSRPWPQAVASRAAAAGSPPTPAPPSSSTSRTARSSRRRATPHTTRRSGPAASAQANLDALREPGGRHAAGLPGHRRDDAAGLDVQGRLDDGGRGDGRRPRRHSTTARRRSRWATAPSPTTSRATTAILSLQRNHRGLVRHDLVPLRVPVLARAGRARRDGRRRRPVRHGGQGLRARAADRRRPARRGGRADPRPGVEARDVGATRRPRPARGPRPATPRSRPPTRPAPTTSRRSPSRTATPGWQYRAGDAANFAIGQGDIAVTPLQLARVYAAVANGGTLWVPQVAAATQNQDGSARTRDPAGGRAGPCR